MLRPIWYPDQQVRLLSGGKEFFDLVLRLINDAQELIHVQVYIFEPDETGHLVADALISAAKRGVSVYLLVDSYGSDNLDKAFIEQLKDNGVHFRFFEPLLRSKKFYFGRRMHQKVIVVDAQYALVTGANIGDKYNDQAEHKAWLDFALCLEGQIVADLCRICWITWFNYNLTKNRTIHCKPASNDDSSKLALSWSDCCSVRIRRNDWVRRKSEISQTYRQIFRQAKKRVILVSSYFLPGRTVQQDIEAATKRGVKVQIIICGRMDVPLVKDAERFMYNWLLKHGVEIYEYQGTMLHGKLATCDEKWLTVGSFNVNDLSARVSIELNLEVKSEQFVQRTIHDLEQLMQDKCLHVKEHVFHANNHLLSLLIRWLSFKMLRVFLFVGTFYMKQEK